MTKRENRVVSQRVASCESIRSSYDPRRSVLRMRVAFVVPAIFRRIQITNWVHCGFKPTKSMEILSYNQELMT